MGAAVSFDPLQIQLWKIAGTAGDFCFIYGRIAATYQNSRPKGRKIVF